MKPIILSLLLIGLIGRMCAIPLDQDHNKTYPLATLLAKAYIANQELSVADSYMQTKRRITKTGASFSFSIADNVSGHVLKHKLQDIHGGNCIEFHDGSDTPSKEEFPLGVFLGPYITDGLVYCFVGPEVCPGTVARCETNGSVDSFERMQNLLKSEQYEQEKAS